MKLIDADAITYESIDSSDTSRHWQYHGTGIIAVRKEDIDKMPPAQPEIIRCKDCKHKPSGNAAEHDVIFPDDKCPCLCEDYWYSWIPRDDWYCGNAERKEDNEMSELITKQAMRDMITNHRSDFSNEVNYRTALACVDAVLPTQFELPWVSVEQELPQIGECVLCKTTARYFGKYHVCKFVDKDNWVDKPHFDWDTHGFPHVIAWARFEPYEEVME